MRHPIGRHHRRDQSLLERLWALFALTLASALAYLSNPNTLVRAAIEPAPGRAERPLARPQRSEDIGFLGPGPCSFTALSVAFRRESDDGDTDVIAGALVRPYMTASLWNTPTIPRPRPASGDLLAEPVASNPPEDLDDLATAIRTYLRVRGPASGAPPATRSQP
ncbi:hypothetical protein [Nocardiopsis alkaliphila]|uniref:hypothetical protein n=1 Tax=Nocardiopsis alkaliphila TaxID=225762 RepID=UPI0003448CC1|nr:hypothetical protein [Nocardiopsis alkaliphila]